MNALRVDKGKLLEILKSNRDAHLGVFLAAQKVYRKAAIAELDNMLQDALDGALIRKHVNLAAPENHTEDYERLIGLLELSTDVLVDLTAAEYSNYVQDNWAWSVRAKRLNEAYSSNNISPMFVGEDVRLPSSY